MKITKELQRLLDRRANYGGKLLRAEVAVHNWCKKHNIDLMDIDFQYGCMLVTEPESYRTITREFIERQ